MVAIVSFPQIPPPAPPKKIVGSGIRAGFRPSGVSPSSNWPSGELFQIYLQRAGGDPIPIMLQRGMGLGILA